MLMHLPSIARLPPKSHVLRHGTVASHFIGNFNETHTSRTRIIHLNQMDLIFIIDNSCTQCAHTHTFYAKQQVITANFQWKEAKWKRRNNYCIAWIWCERRPIQENVTQTTARCQSTLAADMIDWTEVGQNWGTHARASSLYALIHPSTQFKRHCDAVRFVSHFVRLRIEVRARSICFHFATCSVTITAAPK